MNVSVAFRHKIDGGGGPSTSASFDIKIQTGSVRQLDLSDSWDHASLL